MNQISLKAVEILNTNHDWFHALKNKKGEILYKISRNNYIFIKKQSGNYLNFQSNSKNKLRLSLPGSEEYELNVTKYNDSEYNKKKKLKLVYSENYNNGKKIHLLFNPGSFRESFIINPINVKFFRENVYYGIRSDTPNKLDIYDGSGNNSKFIKTIDAIEII
jgi:hypothetical protein